MRSCRFPLQSSPWRSIRIRVLFAILRILGRPMRLESLPSGITWTWCKSIYRLFRSIIRRSRRRQQSHEQFGLVTQVSRLRRLLFFLLFFPVDLSSSLRLILLMKCTWSGLSWAIFDFLLGVCSYEYCHASYLIFLINTSVFTLTLVFDFNI